MRSLAVPLPPPSAVSCLPGLLRAGCDVVYRDVLFCCLRVSHLAPVRVMSCMDESSKTLMPDCPAALLPDWGSGLGSKAAVAPCLTLEDV